MTSKLLTVDHGTYFKSILIVLPLSLDCVNNGLKLNPPDAICIQVNGTCSIQTAMDVLYFYPFGSTQKLMRLDFKSAVLFFTSEPLAASNIDTIAARGSAGFLKVMLTYFSKFVYASIFFKCEKRVVQ